MNKIYNILMSPGYIEKTEKKELRIELSKEEILQLIKEGRLRVRQDGYVEVIDNQIIDLPPDHYTTTQ